MRGDWIDAIHRCVRAGFWRFGRGCGHRSELGPGVASLDGSDFAGRHASGCHEIACDRHDPGALHRLCAPGEYPSDGECRGGSELHGARHLR